MEGVELPNEDVPLVLPRGTNLENTIEGDDTACFYRGDPLLGQLTTCEPDYECDITAVKGTLCRCEPKGTADVAPGSDTCEEFYSCVRTPCKVCSDCLTDMTPFAVENLFIRNSTILSTAFEKHCADKGYSTDSCKSVATKIKETSAPVFFAKRAGSLCSALGVCDITKYPATCQLRATGTLQGPANTTFDLCKVQGLDVTNATDVPGSTTEFDLPAGRCDSNNDCGDVDKYCNKDKSKLQAFCTCYSKTGQDTCRDLGVCEKHPCPNCRDCLQDFSGFVNSVTGNTSEVADAFYTECIARQRNTLACQAARVAIINSYRGNAGRRAGGICRLLGECDTTAMKACK